MAEFKNPNQQGQFRPESAKREQESASKAGKSAHEQRERDRASQAAEVIDHVVAAAVDHPGLEDRVVQAR